jgi:UDP-N-acetylmuramate--alanine ligase
MGNSRCGKGPFLVAEVDESDPGFAKLVTDTAVITNLEDDHIAGDFAERRNYHASLADLEAAALSYAQAAQRVVYYADWPSLGVLLKGLPQAITFGHSKTAHYRISQEKLLEGSSQFMLDLPDGGRLNVRLIVPGLHNIQNASAALTVAHLYGLDMARASEALAAYKGVGRRWQRWGNISGALIIDDYAHHPTEVKATLLAAKHTGRQVRAVLQPHRWVRTARHWPALADAVGLADEILVLDIYSAGETAIPGISSELIVERLKQAGKKASYHNLMSAQNYLANSLRENDLVITLGAGDVWRVAAGLVAEAGQHGRA